ncbi:uncharacterized protein K444DRAFT_638263 [Hyaloscypha bicolor E]|jgi:hypothetical protein|uniref:Uncharacterized protein n=1 Tax=Hyaloscypha bicolor E TaxID=1095630 RepID=A0A2J6SH05_9HELO|nr:uncharacterized protein K444DRAFT_638263 [Hyaloscypha bicolor E]PMD50051.1 hypothetical protein K444DRAFT_638263 [Hyaloscypha bicolor E]
MRDGGQPACNRGNGGQSRYTLFHWLGASGGEPTPQSGPVLTGLPRRILDTVRPKCSSQAPAFGKWQHTRFLTQSAAVDTPVSAVNLTLNHSTTDPHMCVADPGRQTHLTFWLWREAGLRLSLLLASSSITCSWTMGTAEVALPIGSLLDESPPSEVIH